MIHTNCKLSGNAKCNTWTINSKAKISLLAGTFCHLVTAGTIDLNALFNMRVNKGLGKATGSMADLGENQPLIS